MTSTDVAVSAPAAPAAVERREVASQYTLWGLTERASYAKMLAGANDLLPSGIKGGSVDQVAARVFLALETGDMLGLHPMAAVGGIDIIEGNPTISPQLALGLLKKAGHRYGIEETGSVEGGDLKVTVTIWRTDEPEPQSKSYSMRDALRAGLLDTYKPDAASGEWIPVARSRNGNPLNWEKYPADMCQWRAVGRLMRAFAPDVMLGVSYFPEELEANVTADGIRADIITPDQEADYIEKIKGYDDKADMAALWLEIEHADGWTSKLRATFDAHLSTLTKDSRPPREGAPGQTGDPTIDEPTESDAAQTEPGQDDDGSAPASESPADESQPVTEASTAPGEVVTPEAEEETDAERERREYREWQDEQAAAGNA